LETDTSAHLLLGRSWMGTRENFASLSNICGHCCHPDRILAKDKGGAMLLERVGVSFLGDNKPWR
jgi:hypothetical protein